MKHPSTKYQKKLPAAQGNEIWEMALMWAETMLPGLTSLSVSLESSSLLSCHSLLCCFPSPSVPSGAQPHRLWSLKDFSPFLIFLVSSTKEVVGSSQRAYLSSYTHVSGLPKQRIQINSFRRGSGCLKQVAWQYSKKPNERDWRNRKITHCRSKYSECPSGDMQRWAVLTYLAC